jgi:dTDP-4-amino-4,6-dideoxygalactose transaminase
MLNFFSPLESNKIYKNKILSSISKVIDSGKYILGDNVRTFEKNICKYLKAKYAVAVNSGTDALVASMICLNISSDDEVIVPSHTATATISSIKLLKAKPVYVDINTSDYTIDTTKLLKLITSKTKAIIGVHIYGHPCENLKITEICKNKKIFYIEDCAQAMGSEINNKKIGTFGDLSCFSFYPTKNLSAVGDAGAVVTDNYNYYKKILKIRQYGWNEKRISVTQGINSRCDELQAAILNIKIKFLDKCINKRRFIAKFYNKNLKNLPISLPVEKSLCKHSYHLYVIRVNKFIRNNFLEYMKKKKIILGIHYDPPCHMMKNFRSTEFKLSNTEKISKEIVSLPIYPELSKKDLNKVIKNIILFFKKN